MVLRQPMLSSWDIIKKKIELILYSFFPLFIRRNLDSNKNYVFVHGYPSCPAKSGTSAAWHLSNHVLFQ